MLYQSSAFSAGLPGCGGLGVLALTIQGAGAPALVLEGSARSSKILGLIQLRPALIRIAPQGCACLLGVERLGQHEEHANTQKHTQEPAAPEYERDQKRQRPQQPHPGITPYLCAYALALLSGCRIIPTLRHQGGKIALIQIQGAVFPSTGPGQTP